MAEQAYKRVERIVTTHDLSWLLELERRGQLDLEPPYQRRSVWTAKDRRFFMDTIFQNYPSPAIFLHKTVVPSTGVATYHVVDGKQRISTILLFLKNKVMLPPDFGDARFAAKRWRDFASDDDAMSRLWNYRITVEEIDVVSPVFVKEVFERINKNSRRLTAQELRHARFDGWMITFLENEVAEDVWKRFKIHTTAKEKRMADVQNVAELAMIVAHGSVVGFDQEDIDEFFAEHDQVEDEVEDGETAFDFEGFTDRFRTIRDWLARLDSATNVVAGVAQPFLHFYTLWAYANDMRESELDLIELEEFGARYMEFMTAVAAFQIDPASEEVPERPEETPFEALVAKYKAASIGATTDWPKRLDRLDALKEAMSLP